MKPVALIVEDNKEVGRVLCDRVASMGHDHQLALSQTDARAYLSHRTFNYVLLDLELPLYVGGFPMIQVGKNILYEIRHTPRHQKTPVLIVTSHGHNAPDLAVELMKAGAVDFVKKPFDTLEASVREALHRGAPPPPVDEKPAASNEPEVRELQNPVLQIYPDRVDLNGVTICTPEAGIAWRILMQLRERKADGSPRPFPGKSLADRLALERGQNAVSDSLSPFRRKIIQTMSQAGIAADMDTVITTGRAGYQLNPALRLEDLSNQQVPSDDQASSAPASEQRQAWVLERLQAGEKLRRSDFEEHFGISTATAKRDLGALLDRIQFVGTGAAGHYQLK